MIFSETDILAGMPFGAALARKNIAGESNLTAEFLHAKAATFGVAPVT
jgi:hypothetical protein